MTRTETTERRTKTITRVADKITGRLFLFEVTEDGRLGIYHEEDAIAVAEGTATPYATLTVEDASARMEEAGVTIVRI